MSTRANIRIYREDGTKTGIYCHSDGYIENLGVILQTYYSTADRVEKLLALGHCSSVDAKIPESADDFMRYTEWAKGLYPDYDAGYCIPYTMWRGEEFGQQVCDEEYNYIFIESEACWIVQNERKVHSKILDEDWYGAYDSRFLIDAIVSDVSEKFWGMWAEQGVTKEACIKAAKDARVELERKRAAEYEAYYRAYCD